MRQVNTLYREPLKESDGQCFVVRALQHLLDGHDRDDQPPGTHRLHDAMRGPHTTFGGFALEIDQE
jgi:hypothetical protein